MVSKPVSYHSAHGSRAPKIFETLPRATVLERKVKTRKSMLFPEGICTSCQNITIDGLFKTHSGSGEYLWFNYDHKMPTDCPMCKIILNSIGLGNKVKGKIAGGLWLRAADNLKPDSKSHIRAQIREVRVMTYYGFDGANAAGGYLRIYAEPGA